MFSVFLRSLYRTYLTGDQRRITPVFREKLTKKEGHWIDRSPTDRLRARPIAVQNSINDNFEQNSEVLKPQLEHPKYLDNNFREVQENFSEPTEPSLKMKEVLEDSSQNSNFSMTHRSYDDTIYDLNSDYSLIDDSGSGWFPAHFDYENDLTNEFVDLNDVSETGTGYYKAVDDINNEISEGQDIPGSIRPGSLTSSCYLNGTVQLEFEYQPIDAELDQAFVNSSNSTKCGRNSENVILTKIDNSLGKWRIVYDRNSCGYEGDSVMSNTTLYFSQGFKTGSDFLAIRRQAIKVVCRFETFHTVEYDFSAQKTEETYNTTAYTSSGIQFKLKVFSDAVRKTELVKESLMSGTPIYITLSSSISPEISNLTFAPSSCVFKQTGGKKDQSYTLFEAGKNNCDQPVSDLEFALDFRRSNFTWEFQYRLFTFGDSLYGSSYKLSCGINACFSENWYDSCDEIAKQCDNNYANNEEFWSQSSVRN